MWTEHPSNSFTISAGRYESVWPLRHCDSLQHFHSISTEIKVFHELLYKQSDEPSPIIFIPQCRARESVLSGDDGSLQPCDGLFVFHLLLHCLASVRTVMRPSFAMTTKPHSTVILLFVLANRCRTLSHKSASLSVAASLPATGNIPENRYKRKQLEEKKVKRTEKLQVCSTRQTGVLSSYVIKETREDYGCKGARTRAMD